MGIELETLENLLRLPVARNSYRQSLESKGLDTDVAGYTVVGWSFDDVLRVPACCLTMKPTGVPDILILGPCLLFKRQVGRKRSLPSS